MAARSESCRGGHSTSSVPTTMQRTCAGIGMRQAAPTAARSTEPHPESARFAPAASFCRSALKCPRHHLAVSAPRLSFQAANCPSPRTAARVGGDFAQPGLHPYDRRFQSTPPRRGRPDLSLLSATLRSGFNPRPRVGGDPQIVASVRTELLFQSTPPRRGRRWHRAASAASLRFQSTPPRRGRPWYIDL